MNVWKQHNDSLAVRIIYDWFFQLILPYGSAIRLKFTIKGKTSIVDIE